MKKHIAWFLLLVAATAPGCSAPPDRHGEAEKTVEKLYSALEQKEWNTALDMYGKQFYQGTPRKAWLAHLESVQQRLGDMQSHSQTFMQRQSKYYRSDVYIIGYSVTYKHGESEDTITLYQPPGNKKMFIAGHRIVEHPSAQ